MSLNLFHDHKVRLISEDAYFACSENKPWVLINTI